MRREGLRRLDFRINRQCHDDHGSLDVMKPLLSLPAYVNHYVNNLMIAAIRVNLAAIEQEVTHD
jgi:hypothetical protein